MDDHGSASSLLEMLAAVAAALGLGGGGIYARRQYAARQAPAEAVVDLTKSLDEIRAEAVQDALQARDMEDVAHRIGEIAVRVEQLERDAEALRLDLIRREKIDSGRTGKTYLAADPVKGDHRGMG